MVEESVEHAFDDLAVRRWIEAKLKANETLAATKNALAACADEIDKDYRAKIEFAARDVEKVLAAENSDGGSGDLKQLQNAITRLDEITKPLAELLMDRVMEAMLKKRGLIQ
jgi:molecular chaperone DnaK (HSP70)